MSQEQEIATRTATIIVIGAGQAGLSAGHHLARMGYADATVIGQDDPTPNFVILDANSAPGGAWQHRWNSLTMETVNGIFDLPSFPKPPIDPATPSRSAVPQYFSSFEQERGLPILRPAVVGRVFRSDDDLTSDFLLDTSIGRWRAKGIINATGSWNNPVTTDYPGQAEFQGRQLHTRDYASADEFAGQKIAIVGGGISAVQLLAEISKVATTYWYTLREPVFLDGNFRPEVEGRETIMQVAADAEAGNPQRSIVSYTGLGWTPYAVDAKERGVLVRRPMFTAIEPEGVREADGSITPVDAILWATGFRPDVAHLDPLGLRNANGSITVTGTQIAAEPRIHLIGYGPSQSTVGANRAGRAAVKDLTALLGWPNVVLRAPVTWP